MSNFDAAVITQPCEGPLHHEPQPITMRPGVLAERPTPTARPFENPLWDDRHHPIAPQGLPESGAVVGPIRQDPTRTRSTSTAPPASHRHTAQNPARQLQFVDVGRLQGEGEGRSPSVDEDFPFGPFSDLRDADTAAPFLAGAKLASRMPWDNFSRPRFPSCPNNTRNTRGHTPSRCHRTSRSQQVAGDPYSRGMSRQRQPVLSTKRMPLIVLRSSTRGRPCRFIRGNSGLRNFQFLADRSVSRIRASFLGVSGSV